jgi:glyceraldehyde-3-phosphate dehydrogenase/erythrose-4-phosphate dehydrogenase
MSGGISYRDNKEIAEAIENYWAEKGQSVRCEIVLEQTGERKHRDSKQPHLIKGVRSDMLNGLPRKGQGNVDR